MALPIVLAVHENGCFCGQETGIAVSVHEIGPFYGQKHDCEVGKRAVKRANMIERATKLDFMPAATCASPHYRSERTGEG